jgi:hypothetical protein
MSKNSAKSNYTQLTEWLNVFQSKRPKTPTTRKPSEWYEAELAKRPKL